MLWNHYYPLLTHLSISKLGYIAPSCKYDLLSNMLLVCFLWKINHNISRYICVKKMAIALASKVNTMAKSLNLFTQKFWIRPLWFWCLRGTFHTYIFNLLSSRLHMLYFALFRCVTSYLFYFCSWPGQNIPHFVLSNRGVEIY